MLPGLSSAPRWRTTIDVVASLTVFADGNSRAVLVGAMAVPATAVLAVTTPDPGPMSWHMAIHIAAMNVAAPVAAVMAARAGWTRAWARPQALWAATIVQLIVLWAAHSPFIHDGMQTFAVAAVAVHVLLLLAALTFWLSLVAAETHKWQAMLALLVSGKLACLLGVLLIFAPRPLFAGHGAHHDHGAALADQHLAGLLMVAACPLSYVLTAVVLAAQAIGGRDPTPSLPIAEAPGGR